MKKHTFLDKIVLLLVRQFKKEGFASRFNKDFNQQPHYTARNIGDKGRKKSIREKWQLWRQKRSVQLGRTGNTTSNLKGKLPLQLLRPLLLVGVVLVAVYLTLAVPIQSVCGNVGYFRIHEIGISGCVMTSPKGLREFADISYEMNMLTLNPREIRERLQSHPWIAVAKIRRIWPDRLVIQISENRPKALVTHDGEEGFEYLNRKGILFAAVMPGQDLDFPVITGLDGFTTDSEREQLLKSALSFLRLAEKNNPSLPAQNVSEIHFDADGGLIVYLVEYPFPIYFGTGEVRRKYDQLYRVLNVLYRKRKGKPMIENVAYIRMDYQENKVLVAKNHAG